MEKNEINKYKKTTLSNGNSKSITGDRQQSQMNERKKKNNAMMIDLSGDLSECKTRYQFQFITTHMFFSDKITNERMNGTTKKLQTKLNHQNERMFLCL